MAVKFASVKSVVPFPFADTWDALRAELLEHRESESKMDGELYSPVSYLPNTTRSAVNVESVWCLVADLDGEHYDEVCEVAQRYEHLAYTTFSHSFASPHFHIVFPLAERVPSFEWREVWVALHDLLKIKGDPATKDPSRLFFMPQHASGSPFQVIANEGELLDPTPFRSFTVPTQRSRERRSNVSKGHPAILDPKWWDAPVDLSQYDGMTQAEIHRDIQREWAEFRKRIAI
jgi:hypothetical protein